MGESIGTEEGKNNREADTVAIIRTLIMIQLVITNGFIIANAIRHWNNVPSELSQTEEKGYATHKATFMKIEDAIFWEKVMEKQDARTFASWLSKGGSSKVSL